MKKQKSTVCDCEGETILTAKYEVDEYGHVEDQSITFDAENAAEDDSGNEDEETGIKDLPKPPKSVKCRICGYKHYGRCFDCPHDGDIAKYGTYENSPCADCMGPSSHMMNGHGKVLLLDEAAHGDKYQPPAPIESDANYILILDILRSFAALSSEEFSTFMLVNYFSKTYVDTGKELEKTFKGSFKKNRVMKLLQSSKEKLSEVITAGKIINGKLMGQ